MSRPKGPQSRHLTVRVQPGSALERLVFGPRGSKLGYSKRLHEVAERYDALLHNGAYAEAEAEQERAAP